MKRGYCGIGIYHGKTEHNIGTLWRSAFIFGADFLFTIGRRYQKQSSDTVAAWRHLPLFNFSDMTDFLTHVPYDCHILCIELSDSARQLKGLIHPERAIYLLGSEDGGIPKDITSKYQVISIPSEKPFSLNVATAGSIVLYDRFIKGGA